MGKEYSSFDLNLFRLDGKVAVITGANQGLGMAYAIALAKAGADIFVPHFTDDVTAVRDAVEKAGRRIAFYQGDLTDDAYRKACVQECLRVYGKIDILINNAGMNVAAELLEFPDDKWQQVVQLQLEAVHYFSRQVALAMAPQRSGKIINIASALSFAADLNASAYTVAKHGIVGLTRSYAAELGKYNITCNAIAPGFFYSDMNKMMIEKMPELYQKVCDRIPLSSGNWGDVFDLMGTAVYLASSASDYVSGVVIPVDGGFKAQMV